MVGSLEPKSASPSSLLADAWANSDFGLVLSHVGCDLSAEAISRDAGHMFSGTDSGTYFPTLLLRSAVSFAVQGLIMLSDGEMYCCLLHEAAQEERTGAVS